MAIADHNQDAQTRQDIIRNRVAKIPNRTRLIITNLINRLRGR